MNLTTLDWSIVFSFFALVVAIGVAVSRFAGKSQANFFLGGRDMPWWLLGFSMVATTFSTDTPNFVTDVVRTQGVAGNWNWWAFLITGMLTVFIYARLWRRSGVTTDVEFYTLRYSGRAAAFLRVFRACYLGVAYNVLIMAMVSVAAIKIGAVMLGTSPWETLGIAMMVTVVFSAIGGFKGVLLTDFVLFIISMVGSFAAAHFALNHESVGGLNGLIDQYQTNPALAEKLHIFPDPSNVELFFGVFAVSLAVQWWAAYYPGSEPGGGGYLVQRMLAAKNEQHAVGATLFFNVAHYALRPWPWIIVALCSLLAFPELADIQKAFPAISDDKLGHDVAYSAMIMQTVPSGWLGLIMASLGAAYMSTISTHLNWGASYIVNDLLPQIKPSATEREKVWVGRLSMVSLMLLAAVAAMYLRNAKQAFDLVILVGAGTGLLFILRWFWWRVNAWCEIVAMCVSLVLALLLNTEMIGNWLIDQVGVEFVGPTRILIGVGVTTLCWVLTAYLAPATDSETLRSFYRLIQPSGPGWKSIKLQVQERGDTLDCDHASQNLTLGILSTVVGSVGVYSYLFATGYWIYGRTMASIIWGTVALLCTALIGAYWAKSRPAQ